MPSKEREYRAAQDFAAAENEEYIVEGYASTFEPYVLYRDAENNIDYYEQIAPTAFEGCDMSDVVFLYNHDGKVFARQKNGTLELTVDEHGLKVRADLSKTEASRQMYEEIKSGLIDQMSFAFVVDRECYDKKKHTRTIERMRKLYDVSAVSFPANPGTDISARSWLNGAIEAEQAERLAEQKRSEQMARIKIMLGVQDNGNQRNADC